MPLSAEMKALADQIFTREHETISKSVAEERQQVVTDARKRNILQSGIYVGNLLRLNESFLRRICEARANSYSEVLREGRGLPTDEDLVTINQAVAELANQYARNLAENTRNVAAQAGCSSAYRLDQSRSSVGS
jgi:hypothetical protein